MGSHYLYARYAPQFHELAGGRASDEKQRVCMPSLLAHQEHPLTPLHVPLSYEVSQVGGGGPPGVGPCISMYSVLIDLHLGQRRMPSSTALPA